MDLPGSSSSLVIKRIHAAAAVLSMYSPVIHSKGEVVNRLNYQPILVVRQGTFLLKFTCLFVPFNYNSAYSTYCGGFLCTLNY